MGFHSIPDDMRRGQNTGPKLVDIPSRDRPDWWGELTHEVKIELDSRFQDEVQAAFQAAFNRIEAACSGKARVTGREHLYWPTEVTEEVAKQVAAEIALMGDVEEVDEVDEVDLRIQKLNSIGIGPDFKRIANGRYDCWWNRVNGEVDREHIWARTELPMGEIQVTGADVDWVIESDWVDNQGEFILHHVCSARKVEKW